MHPWNYIDKFEFLYLHLSVRSQADLEHGLKADLEHGLKADLEHGLKACGL